jgi:hypothetical protein
VELIAADGGLFPGVSLRACEPVEQRSDVIQLPQARAQFTVEHCLSGRVGLPTPVSLCAKKAHHGSAPLQQLTVPTLPSRVHKESILNR